MDELRRLGEQIFRYFIKITSENEYFILHIDESTYRICAKAATLSDTTITDLLAGRGINHFNPENDFEALAIVALEIKIFYDIETESELINSYNQRLEKNIKYFKSQQDIQEWYKSYQETIWKRVENLFIKANRYIEIPQEHFGAYRYVQYPKSQRLISQRDIILYANEFKKHLIPHQVISFIEFKKKVHFKDIHKEEQIQRMIFSFYNMWNGESSDEILDHRNISHIITNNYTKKDINIKIDVTQVSVFIDRKEIDLNSFSIKTEWLYQFDSRSHYFTKKGLPFIKDELYDDWITFYGNIDLNDEIIFLSKKTLIPSYLQEYIESGEIKILNCGEYMLWTVSSNTSDVYIRCKLSLAEKTCIALIGGIKSNRNTYYDFAKPIIKINQLLDSKKKPYKTIFIDTNEYPLTNNTFHFPDDFPIGIHYVKLWDSTDLKFSIIKTGNEESDIETHGWNVDYDNGKVIPALSTENIIIDGFIRKQELRLHKHKDNIIIQRQFEIMNERFKNRFQRNFSMHGV